MAASNCGQILQEREDPFDLKVIKIFEKEMIYLSVYLLGSEL
jgi:hypothetical protein